MGGFLIYSYVECRAYRFVNDRKRGYKLGQEGENVENFANDRYKPEDKDLGGWGWV